MLQGPTQRLPFCAAPYMTRVMTRGAQVWGWGLAVLLTLAQAQWLPLAHADASAADPCGRGWVYFDLGNTIIDTTDWDHLKYMPLAREYVRDLRTAGFKVGLITNVPESWGATFEAKMATLKNEIATPWSDAHPFDWNDFDEILLPPTNADRKPAPYLFMQALQLHPLCQLAFQGDDAAEAIAASDAGFKTSYLVGKNAPHGFFLPVDKIFSSAPAEAPSAR
jgi:hypothetical protein